MALDTFQLICYGWLAVALIVHVTMFFVTAPFGRHTTNTWGPTINNKLGWVIMEFPSLAIMAYFLFTGTQSFTTYAWVLFALWIFHYVNRTFVYPVRMRATPKQMPVAIVASAVFFNLVNAGLNGYYLGELADPAKYDSSWLTRWHVIVGGILFLAGMYINWRSDNILIHLRKPGETGYKIPRGFLFDRITAPNHFGEIVEWGGFALMAWNLPALTFFAWTCANLIPRAKNHHDWYKARFPEYPEERKVVLPYIY